MKKIGLLILIFLHTGVLFATHQKAGEITYQHIAGFTYRFTIVTYTYTETPADRPLLEIHWGHQDQISQAFRTGNGTPIGNYTKVNYYVIDHTFPGSGIYTISMEDPMRNAGVVNIPNSVNTEMYLETTLMISPYLNPKNSSPTLLNQPIDRGCYGVPFMHNPGAFDVDGDSLAYKIVDCRGGMGLAIPGFSLPRASKTLEINPVTGDLLWDSPETVGEHNLAILIEEYRSGVHIGSVMRDMQITIEYCDNRPPEIEVTNEICTFAGDSLTVPVVATDPDSTDILTLSATGGILQLPENSAVFNELSGRSPLQNNLRWIPQHEHVQQNPHAVYFRAQDNGNPNLNTLKTLLIRVNGRAPQWDSLSANYDQITLNWKPILNENIDAYRIYRSHSKTGQTTDSCDYGMQDTTYQLLAELKDRNLSMFSDTTAMQNAVYCYRILAVYKNKMLSQMSDEICGNLLSNTPILEAVSVETTDIANGKIKLVWRAPLDFDIHENPNDFRYVIHRSFGVGAFETLDTIDDTACFDEGLNTLENYYYYQIELIRRQAQTWVSVGFSNEATSIFAHATGKNKRVNVQWQYTQPWKNMGFAVFRKQNGQNDFDSIAYVEQTYFTDADVQNDTIYTYKIKAFGTHYSERLKDFLLINWSQETQAMPQVDTPCRLRILLDESICNPAKNRLSWESYDSDCYDENVTYHLFYRQTNTASFKEIATLSENFYTHQNMSMNIGCYYVTASNAKGFVSVPSDTVCVECLDYELPNIFTPNDDGVNDLYKAILTDYTGNFTIKIFNRWGRLVFESNDPNFEWNGTNQISKKPCPEGVYFYVAELWVQGLESPFRKTLKGSITILR